MSIYPSNRVPSDVKRTDSRKTLSVKHSTKAMKKSENTSPPSKVVTFPGRPKINVPDPSSAASTTAGSIGTFAAHEILDDKMNDGGILTFSTYFFSSKKCAFHR